MSVSAVETNLDRRKSKSASWLGWAGPAVVLLSYAPLLRLHADRLWSDDYYRHFPLVLLAAGLLLWDRCFRGEHAADDSVPRGRGWICLLFGWLLLAGAILLWSPWLAAVSAIVTVGGLLRQHAATAGNCFSVWLLLWLLVPLPFRWDSQLVFSLQGLASRGASHLLDSAGYEHLLTGHVIEVVDQRFLVEEACSGIRSLFVLFALTAVLLVWRRRGPLHALLLLGASVFWALTINVIRVAAVVVFFQHGRLDVSDGLNHQLLGGGLFLVGLLMILCTDVFLRLLLQPIPAFDLEDWDDSDGARRGSSRRRRSDSVAGEAGDARWSRPAGITAMGLFAALGLTQLVAVGWGGQGGAGISLDPKRDLQLAESSLPPKLANWRRSGFELQERQPHNALGKWSAVWNYGGDDPAAVVSLDYPFVGWHELVHCYQAQGWTVAERKTVLLPPQDDPLQTPLVEVHLRRASGGHGLLLFSQFDGRGRPVRPPGSGGWEASFWYGALRSREHKRMTDFGFDVSTYQVQLFIEGGAPLSQRRRAQAVAAFLQARRLLRERLPLREDGLPPGDARPPEDGSPQNEVLTPGEIARQ